jgi:NAD(P)-dependent dehydrogenase (short-subunit alcohol dehydrogenase family)
MEWAMTSLDGRTALVTGASRGIGREVARTFAAHGADVAIAARSAEPLESLAKEIREMGRTCVVIVADVLQEDSAQRIADEALSGLGAIDILVNNAGGNSFMSPVVGMRPSGWRKTMTLNLDSIFSLIQSVLPGMVEAKRGSIINVASVAGLRGAPLMSHYGAAKAALISLTQSLAVETAQSGVRVNALVPGWIDTELTDFLRQNDAAETGVLSRVPMARWGRAEEIAAGALFLASDASSFMTGQILILDGGLSAMP